MKKILICASLLLVGVSTVVAAQSNLEEIKGYLNSDIRFSLNAAPWTPKSADGQVLSPLIVNGSTYLPVRAVAEAVGLDVGWLEQQQTVELKTKAAATVDPSLPYKDATQNSPDILADFDFTQKSSDPNGPKINLNESFVGETIRVGTRTAVHGISSGVHSQNGAAPTEASVEFLLHGEYKKLTGFVGMHKRISKYQDGEVGILQIFGDNKLLATFQVKDGQEAQDITVPIAQVEKLKLVFTMEKGKGSWAMIDFGNALVSK
ncbi:NPCBM/NEW2 domain-containing protein [Paenibacillus qinlingensis]|uniref:Glycosyl hydrolase family 98 putative carbohydrate-binding module domain-containing protein n=1 Tax=Paenibacillus qinlingensis TaxID=1837343 RepID=A0ABU1P1U8_9BACL|nr:NPCBM/NEW2 domain-containing protein [Paenibacillus qinlingensis]MDR6553720.1 hypothetical protein [Paenibacillus qinlingensis]